MLESIITEDNNFYRINLVVPKTVLTSELKELVKMKSDELLKHAEDNLQIQIIHQLTKEIDFLEETVQEKDAIIKTLEDAKDETESIGELALAFERELTNKENSNKQLREENKALKARVEVQNTVASDLKNHTQKMAFIKHLIDSECTFNLNDRLIKLEDY